MAESIKSKYKPEYPKNIKVIQIISFVGAVGKDVSADGVIWMKIF